MSRDWCWSHSVCGCLSYGLFRPTYHCGNYFSLNLNTWCDCDWSNPSFTIGMMILGHSGCIGLSADSRHDLCVCVNSNSLRNRCPNRCNMDSVGLSFNSGSNSYGKGVSFMIRLRNCDSLDYWCIWLGGHCNGPCLSNYSRVRGPIRNDSFCVSFNDCALCWYCTVGNGWNCDNGHSFFRNYCHRGSFMDNTRDFRLKSRALANWLFDFERKNYIL